MNDKGARYKTEPFILWSRLCLKLQLRYKAEAVDKGDDATWRPYERGAFAGPV